METRLPPENQTGQDQNYPDYTSSATHTARRGRRLVNLSAAPLAAGPVPGPGYQTASSRLPCMCDNCLAPAMRPTISTRRKRLDCESARTAGASPGAALLPGFGGGVQMPGYLRLGARSKGPAGCISGHGAE